MQRVPGPSQEQNSVDGKVNEGNVHQCCMHCPHEMHLQEQATQSKLPIRCLSGVCENLLQYRLGEQLQVISLALCQVLNDNRKDDRKSRLKAPAVVTYSSNQRTLSSKSVLRRHLEISSLHALLSWKQHVFRCFLQRFMVPRKRIPL